MDFILLAQGFHCSREDVKLLVENGHTVHASNFDRIQLVSKDSCTWSFPGFEDDLDLLYFFFVPTHNSEAVGVPSISGHCDASPVRLVARLSHLLLYGLAIILVPSRPWPW
jgi:hypothetical protein